MRALPAASIILIAVSLAGCATRSNQTLSENKAIVLRSEAELWSKGNLEVADELYGAGFICHFIGGTEWKGIQGLKSEVASHRAIFPDWNERVDDIIAEGDRVVIRFTSSGTQRGEFAGMAPSGKKVTIHEAAIFRVVGGKIVEQWGFPDSQSLMQQLMAPAAGKQFSVN
jgi:predicted ester cyclase